MKLLAILALMLNGRGREGLFVNLQSSCDVLFGWRTAHFFNVFFVDVTSQTLLSHTATYKSHRLLTSSLTLYCIVTVYLNKALFKSNVVVSI